MGNRIIENKTNKGSSGLQNILSGKWNLLLILLALVAAGIAGMITGNKIIAMRSHNLEQQNIDEMLGLGERSGISSDLTLNVNPVSVTVRSGNPISVNLILKNRSKKQMTLNGWLTPAPAIFGNNQLPVKQIVKRSGRAVDYTGSAILYPPHEKKDFFILKPDDTKDFKVDLLNGPHGGRWNMLAPGQYSIELWYESYLTGRFIGVNAWTGITNHVVVQVKIIP